MFGRNAAVLSKAATTAKNSSRV